jgi:hypothetical protein
MLPRDQIEANEIAGPDFLLATQWRQIKAHDVSRVDIDR